MKSYKTHFFLGKFSSILARRNNNAFCGIWNHKWCLMHRCMIYTVKSIRYLSCWDGTTKQFVNVHREEIGVQQFVTNQLLNSQNKPGAADQKYKYLLCKLRAELKLIRNWKSLSPFQRGISFSKKLYSWKWYTSKVIHGMVLFCFAFVLSRNTEDANMWYFKNTFRTKFTEIVLFR